MDCVIQQSLHSVGIKRHLIICTSSFGFICRYAGQTVPKEKTVGTCAAMRTLPMLPDEIIRMIMQYVRAPLHHRMLVRQIRCNGLDPTTCEYCVDYTRQRNGYFIIDRVIAKSRNDCECDAPTNALCSECKIALCGEHAHWGCMCGYL